MDYLSPTDCPFYLITRASLAVTAVMRRALAKFELSDIKPAYLGALMCLWADEDMNELLAKLGSDEGMKLTELSRCAGVEPSTMTGLIDRMERDGLVLRINDPGDRRAQKAVLTEKGVLVRSKVVEAVDEMSRQVFSGIEPSELETVKKVLRTILGNANKGVSNHGE